MKKTNDNDRQNLMKFSSESGIPETLDEEDYNINSEQLRSWIAYMKYGDTQEVYAIDTHDNSRNTVSCPKIVSCYLNKRLLQASPLRNIVSYFSTDKSYHKRPVSHNINGYGWHSSDVSRKNEILFSIKDFPMGEMYSNFVATQSILEDYDSTLLHWFINEIYYRFCRLEVSGILFGNAHNQPYGILSYQKHKMSDTQLSLDVENGIDIAKEGIPSYDVSITNENVEDYLRAFYKLILSLDSFYKYNASFVISRSLFSRLIDIQSSSNTKILQDYQDNSHNHIHHTIFTYPVIVIDEMDKDNANDVIFGDFRQGYLLVEKEDMRIIRDPYSQKPHIIFYVSKKIGGSVYNDKALRIMHIE